MAGSSPPWVVEADPSMAWCRMTARLHQREAQDIESLNVEAWLEAAREQMDREIDTTGAQARVWERLQAPGLKEPPKVS